MVFDFPIPLFRRTYGRPGPEIRMHPDIGLFHDFASATRMGMRMVLPRQRGRHDISTRLGTYAAPTPCSRYAPVSPLILVAPRAKSAWKEMYIGSRGTVGGREGRARLCTCFTRKGGPNSCTGGLSSESAATARDDVSREWSVPRCADSCPVASGRDSCTEAGCTCWRWKDGCRMRWQYSMHYINCAARQPQL
ncbi:hypothetical protein BKA93DRAFT_503263 [Sparassis latifolia]